MIITPKNTLEQYAFTGYEGQENSQDRATYIYLNKGTPNIHSIENFLNVWEGEFGVIDSPIYEKFWDKSADIISVYQYLDFIESYISDDFLDRFMQEASKNARKTIPEIFISEIQIKIESEIYTFWCNPLRSGKNKLSDVKGLEKQVSWRSTAGQESVYLLAKGFICIERDAILSQPVVCITCEGEDCSHYSKYAGIYRTCSSSYSKLTPWGIQEAFVVFYNFIGYWLQAATNIFSDVDQDQLAEIFYSFACKIEETWDDLREPQENR